MSHNQEQEYVKLTIIIYARPAYEFMFQFKQNTTVANLLDELQKLYYRDIKQEGIFFDLECSRKATSSYLIAKNKEYFFNFPYQDYEKEMKQVFAKQKIDHANVHKDNGKNTIKNQSIESKQTTTSTNKQMERTQFVNKFSLMKEQKKSKDRDLKEQVSQNDIQINQRQRQIEATPLKQNLKSFDNQQSPGSTSANHISKPNDNNAKVTVVPAANGDCCLLI